MRLAVGNSQLIDDPPTVRGARPVPQNSAWSGDALLHCRSPTLVRGLAPIGRIVALVERAGREAAFEVRFRSASLADASFGPERG